jgi:hypothetical protein
MWIEVDHVTWYEPIYQVYLASYSFSPQQNQIPIEITNPILCIVLHLVILSGSISDLIL